MTESLTLLLINGIKFLGLTSRAETFIHFSVALVFYVVLQTRRKAFVQDWFDSLISLKSLYVCKGLEEAIEMIREDVHWGNVVLTC